MPRGQSITAAGMVECRNDAGNVILIDSKHLKCAGELTRPSLWNIFPMIIFFLRKAGRIFGRHPGKQSSPTKNPPSSLKANSFLEPKSIITSTRSAWWYYLLQWEDFQDSMVTHWPLTWCRNARNWFVQQMHQFRDVLTLHNTHKLKSFLFKTVKRHSF